MAEREEPLMADPRSSKAEPGAPLRSGILVLAHTLMGAGMLSLPAAFAECGYLVGTLLISFFAMLAWTGLHLLSEAADLAGRPSCFNRVANAAVPGGGVFFDLAIAIKCFGVATSYLIVVGDNLPRAMDGFGVTAPLLLQRRTWILVSLLAAGPLAFMRRLSALRHTCVCLAFPSAP
jgi:amino acid permease